MYWFLVFVMGFRLWCRCLGGLLFILVFVNMVGLN